MTGPRIGSLFSGYGGLDMGVQAVIGGSVAWHVEFAEAPSKILAHHWPDVPNYHDVTTVDWSSVEPVDVLTGGFPCQDVSLAGARAGLMDGTRSGLWSEYAKAIDVLRPSLVLIENVRGLLSAKTMEEVDETDSDLEWAEGGVGEPAGVDRPVLNAFGRVLGDLAELGYDSRWIGVSASDAGAPHGRFRVFILAYPAGKPWRFEDRDNVRVGGDSRRLDANAGAGTAGHTENGGRDDASPEEPGEHWESAGEARGSDRSISWGAFEPAIRTWEGLTRPVPTPIREVEGGLNLSPAFTEWMMGLPAGHVTNPVIGITEDEQMKALGNGVVPQQAELALSMLLGSKSHSNQQGE